MGSGSRPWRCGSTFWLADLELIAALPRAPPQAFPLFTVGDVYASLCKRGCAFYLFIRQPHGSEVSPAARNSLDSAPIPTASKLLICGLFQKGRVLAQDGIESVSTLPWCITLDNSKGISRLRFWCKNSRVNGINDLPVFMHQGTEERHCREPARDEP